MEGGGGPAGQGQSQGKPGRCSSPQPPVWLRLSPSLCCRPRGDGAGLCRRQGWDRDLAGSPLQPCLAARLLSLQPSLARSPSSVINHPGWMEPHSWKIPEWSASMVPFPSHKVGEGAGVREPVASSFSDLQRLGVGLQVIFPRLSPHTRPPSCIRDPQGGGLAVVTLRTWGMLSACCKVAEPGTPCGALEDTATPHQRPRHPGPLEPQLTCPEGSALTSRETSGGRPSELVWVTRGEPGNCAVWGLQRKPGWSPTAPPTPCQASRGRPMQW